jgi:hypothetical protein
MSSSVVLPLASFSFVVQASGLMGLCMEPSRTQIFWLKTRNMFSQGWVGRRKLLTYVHKS